MEKSGCVGLWVSWISSWVGSKYRCRHSQHHHVPGKNAFMAVHRSSSVGVHDQFYRRYYCIPCIRPSRNICLHVSLTPLPLTLRAAVTLPLFAAYNQTEKQPNSLSYFLFFGRIRISGLCLLLLLLLFQLLLVVFL